MKPSNFNTNNLFEKPKELYENFKKNCLKFFVIFLYKILWLRNTIVKSNVLLIKES